MSTAIALLGLIVLGVGGKAFFQNVLKEHFGYSFVKTPVLVFGYFLVLTAATLYLYRERALELFTPVTVPAVLFLALVVVLGPAMYVFARRHHAKPLNIPNLEFLSLRRPFLFSKLGDVIFQQTLLGIALLYLSDFMPLGPLLLLFTIAMVAGHADLYFKMPESWALYFVISAGLMSAPLAILILLVPGGIYYAIALHLFWYSAGGVVLSLRHHEQSASM